MFTKRDEMHNVPFRSKKYFGIKIFYAVRVDENKPN